jgi:hypothetical protein
MCGPIVWSEVGFDFHNPADALHAARHMNEVLSE